uniref:Uncharacterized protein n=1 Tax=Myotis myotis TaxID=51298 RepID=A0A7J7Y074_MYOMY|nr:hypothetical protein mMyoMyo1_011534 [Myotis myotis]
MVSTGALQTGVVCTHAFLPLSARQRVWGGGVCLRLPQGGTVARRGQALPPSGMYSASRAAPTVAPAALAQDPLVFSRQLMSSPVLGNFCLKRACFPVTPSRCLQQQHFRFICHVGERGGKN